MSDVDGLVHGLKRRYFFSVVRALYTHHMKSTWAKASVTGFLKKLYI